MANVIRTALISLCLAVLFLWGCSGEVKADERLVETYVELRLVEIVYGADSPMSRLSRQDILKSYGYTREEYLEKIQKVLEDEEQWVPFQKAVTVRLDSLLATPKRETGAPSAASEKGKGPPRTRKGSVEE